MKPCDKGRFCGKCKTAVIDFTKMPYDQVVDFLLNKANQNVCGRYKNHQLGKQKSKVQIFLIKMYQKVYFYQKFKFPKIAILLALGHILTIAGCGNANKDFKGYSEVIIPQNSEDITCGGKMKLELPIKNLPVEKPKKD